MTDNIQEKVEDKVIDCINSEVSGRIIISKPQDSNTDAGRQPDGLEKGCHRSN